MGREVNCSVPSTKVLTYCGKQHLKGKGNYLLESGVRYGNNAQLQITPRVAATVWEADVWLGPGKTRA